MSLRAASPGRLSLPGTYTYATLPAASLFPAGTPAYTSDVGSVTSDGSHWVIGVVRRLGLVATHTGNQQAATSSFKQMSSRSLHYMRDDVGTFQLIFANFYRLDEVFAGGNPMTVEASIEYPVGTFTRVTFGGSNQASVPSGGTVTSDPVNIPIASMTAFYVRTWTNSVDGVMNAFPNRYSGMNQGVTTPNLVMTAGSFGNAGYSYCPLAIIGLTNRPGVVICGDSISRGNSEGLIEDYPSYLGKMFGPRYAYANCGGDGATISGMAGTAFDKRSVILQYATHVAVHCGTNDIVSSGRTAAQVIADLNTFVAKSYMAGKYPFIATITPRASSTDSFVTETNQTVAATDSVRVTANDSIRSSGVVGAHRVIDTTLAVESATNPGKWLAPLGFALTVDGTHMTSRGAQRIASLISAPI